MASVAVFLLYLCTAMIYASIKFLQEWASSLTVLNYILLGGASGFTLATAIAAYNAPTLVSFYGGWAIILTVAGLITRGLSLYRNANLKAVGMMGGSYNTREYFHGKTAAFLKSVKYIFLVLVFPVPVILLVAGMQADSVLLLMLAFTVQYVGLLFERWFFFAQANHPQNLYYQTI